MAYLTDWGSWAQQLQQYPGGLQGGQAACYGPTRREWYNQQQAYTQNVTAQTKYLISCDSGTPAPIKDPDEFTWLRNRVKEILWN